MTEPYRASERILLNRARYCSHLVGCQLPAVASPRGAQGERGGRAEAGELVGVDHRVDAGDAAVCDVEAHHRRSARPSASRASRPGWPLTRASVERGALREADPHEGAERLADRLDADERARQGARLAAAVADQHDVVGEQRDEAVEVAAAGGVDEAGGERVAALGVGVEARAVGVDLVCARGSAAGGRPARPCRARRRSRRSRSRTPRAAPAPRAPPARAAPAARGRRARSSRRPRRGRPGPAARRRGRPADDGGGEAPGATSTSGSGSHSPTYCSRRTRAERSTSIASARGDRRRERLVVVGPVGRVEAQQRLLRDVVGLGGAAQHAVADLECEPAQTLVRLHPQEHRRRGPGRSTGACTACLVGGA